MRIKPENCPHVGHRTTTLGFQECKRCGTDTSNPRRERTHRLSERVLLEIDTTVSISNDGCARDYGRFKYAETNPDTGLVSIAVLCHERGSNGRPISCGWRFVRPDRVRRER